MWLVLGLVLLYCFVLIESFDCDWLLFCCLYCGDVLPGWVCGFMLFGYLDWFLIVLFLCSMYFVKLAVCIMLTWVCPVGWLVIYFWLLKLCLYVGFWALVLGVLGCWFVWDFLFGGLFGFGYCCLVWVCVSCLRLCFWGVWWIYLFDVVGCSGCGLLTS